MRIRRNHFRHSAWRISLMALVALGAATLVANQVLPGLNLDGNIGRFKIITDQFDTTVSLDEFRFGTQLGDVMYLPPPAPEPGSVVLAGLGCLGLILRPRGRRARARTSHE